MADSLPGKPRRPSPHSTVIRRADPTTLRPRAVKAAAPGGVEVVSSGEQLEASRVRARVHSADLTVRGLNLRQKIMIAMASVVLVTTLLIFVVVYIKAVDQLSAEIDAKGAAQAQLMSSIDAEIWITAMYQQGARRENKLTDLIRRVDDQWNPDAARFLGEHQDLKERYISLLNGTLGETRRESFRKFLRALVDARKSGLNDEDRRRTEARFANEIKKETFLADENGLFDPFGEIMPLRRGDTKLLKPEELVQLSVLDISHGNEKPDASVSATEGKMQKMEGQWNPRTVGNLQIFDSRLKTEGQEGKEIPVRSFQLDSGELKTRMGTFRLRYYVLLGLRQIEDAKGALRTIIFLAIFLAVLVGLAIAWWISERISEPVRLLMDDINAVSDGDLDHETVPHSNDEIGQLAGTFNRMTRALKTAHNQELEARALEHELSIASEIQTRLVPKQMVSIPGYDISAFYRPSKEVGGDYYDFIEIDDDHCGFIVADVSGKGVPGSLVMSMARAFIRMEAQRTRNPSPSDTLKRTNRMLAADIKKGMFVTAIYCILNKSTNELAVSSAGHNPMILWRAAANQIQLVNPKGIALGLDKGPVFERTVAEEIVRLEPGDRVTLYTDGTIESMNERWEQFGSQRFYDLVHHLSTRSSGQMLSLIVRALDEHQGKAPQHDDMTMVTLRYAGGT